MHGLCLTWVALWQIRAHEALGAAWPQPRAGAQTCGSGTVGSPRREAMCLGTWLTGWFLGILAIHSLSLNPGYSGPSRFGTVKIEIKVPDWCFI